MASPIVRIDKTSFELLREMSKMTGQSMQAILSKAVENYRRKIFFKKLNDSYLALKMDSRKWKEESKDLEAWDNSLKDGLDND